MSDGISPNKLNDISKIYLDQVSALREVRKQETQKDIERWSQPAKDALQQEEVQVDEEKKALPKLKMYRKAGNLARAGDEKSMKRQTKMVSVLNKETSKGYKKAALDKLRDGGSPKHQSEAYSSWRTELREISDAIPETEKKTEKEVKEKKVKNVVKINPTLPEAVAEIGGELISVEEQTDGPTPPEEDPGMKAKEKRQGMLKKQVLIKKLQAVRMGGGADIVASYDPIEAATDYLYEEGINEEGIDLLIEEIGLDGFVEFVEGSAVELNEERKARRANVKAKSYAQVKKEVDTADAARKKAKKGEYAPSYAKKETDVTVYDKAPAKKKAAAKKAPAGMKKAVARKKAVLKQPVKKTAPKAKGGAIVKAQPTSIVKAVTKVKTAQPAKKTTKQGLASKIARAYKKGVERHKASVGKAKTEVGKVVKTAKATAKQHSKHRKDFVSGISPTAREKKIAKGVGGAVKKALTKEELELLEKYKAVTNAPDSLAKMNKRYKPVKKIKNPTDRPFRDRLKDPDYKVDMDEKLDYDPMKDPTFDPIEAERTRGVSGKNNPKGGKKLKNLTKEELELLEKVKGQDSETRKAMAAERKAGERISKKEAPSRTKNYVARTKQSIKWHDKRTKGRYAPGEITDTNEEVGISSAAAIEKAKKEAKLQKKEAEAVKKVKKEEVNPIVARNDRLNRERAMKAAKEREAKKPSADVIAARKRQYSGKNYTVADKKKVIQSYREDKAFDNVVSMLRKKHGEGSVITKDSPKPKSKPLDAKQIWRRDDRNAVQREVDAQYGRTPWNKKGSLGT